MMEPSQTIKTKNLLFVCNPIINVARNPTLSVAQYQVYPQNPALYNYSSILKEGL